jgi:hypothetical protein
MYFLASSTERLNETRAAKPCKLILFSFPFFRALKKPQFAGFTPMKGWMILTVFFLVLVSDVSRAQDSVSIYSPIATGADVGLTTLSGGSLNGCAVRVGAFSVTPTQLLNSLAGKTSAADVQSTINTSFLEYGTFVMSDGFLQNPDQSIINVTNPIGANLRGKDIYLVFYNNASPSSASEIGIFRMKNRANADAIGIFPTQAGALGNREAYFYIGDIEEILPAQDALNLLAGQYDPLNNRFILSSMAGGIGKITSQTSLKIPPGESSTYWIQANHGPDSFSAVNLPTWASLGSYGVITFAPPAGTSGTYSIDLTASNSLSGKTATATLQVVVQESTLTFITPPNPISATAGVAITPYTFRTSATDPASVTYTTANSLQGLSLSTSGVLSGIPLTVGTSNVTIRATSGGDSGSTTLALAVAPPVIEVPAADLTNGKLVVTAGIARTITITKPAGFTDLTGSINPPYTGVSFDGSSLVVSANAPPLIKGNDNVLLTLTASRAIGGSSVLATTTVPLRIVAPSPTRLTGPNEYEVDVGQLFSTTIQTDVGSYARMTFSNLPPGLSGLSGGLITGTNKSTTLPWEYVAPVRADSTSVYEGGGVFTSNVTFRLRNTSAPYFSPLTNRVVAGVGRPVAYYISANNFPFRFAAANLPLGLSLDGNKISGSPAQAGKFEVSVNAYNSYRPGSTNPAFEQSGSGTIIFQIAKSAPPTALTPTSPGILAKNAPVSLSDNKYLIDAEVNGVYVSAIGLPAGTILDRTTGKLVGTPTTPGLYSVTVFIQNAFGWIRKGVALKVQ